MLVIVHVIFPFSDCVHRMCDNGIFDRLEEISIGSKAPREHKSSTSRFLQKTGLLRKLRPKRTFKLLKRETFVNIYRKR